MASHLGLSVRTLQRAIERPLLSSLMEKRPSTAYKPAQGHVCEYRIITEKVWGILGRKPPREPLTRKDLLDSHAFDVRSLPAKFFSSARWDGVRLIVSTAGPNQQTFELPKQEREVLKWVVEKHYGRAVSEASLDTFCRAAITLTPRLLGLITGALATVKTTPSSAGYYTKVIGDKVVKAMKSSAHRSTKSIPPYKTIRIRDAKPT